MEHQVSIILPAYNAEKYIGLAIESILHQTLKNFELVVVNDASTDSTKSIIEMYASKDSRIKVINNERNLYIGGALNKALAVSSNEFVARMDADDIAEPTRLEKQLNVLLSDDSIAVVGANIELIDEEGKTLGKREYPNTNAKLKSKIFKYSPFAHPVVMFRKSAVLEFGGYDPTKSPSEDLDLWFKIGTKYKFASVNECLLKYRVFKNSHSNKRLKNTELITLKIRLDAVKKLGWKPSLDDILYNLGQFLTLWIIPAGIRIKLFNFIRGSGLL